MWQMPIIPPLMTDGDGGDKDTSTSKSSGRREGGRFKVSPDPLSLLARPCCESTLVLVQRQQAYPRSSSTSVVANSSGENAALIRQPAAVSSSKGCVLIDQRRARLGRTSSSSGRELVRGACPHPVATSLSGENTLILQW